MLWDGPEGCEGIGGCADEKKLKVAWPLLRGDLDQERDRDMLQITAWNAPAGNVVRLVKLRAWSQLQYFPVKRCTQCP